MKLKKFFRSFLFISLLFGVIISITGCTYFPKEEHKITKATIDSENVLEINIESWSKKIQRSYGHSFDYLEDEKLNLLINDKEVDIEERKWITEPQYYGWYKIPYVDYVINARERYYHPHSDVPFTQTGHYLTLWLDFDNLTIPHPIKIELKKDDKIVDSYVLSS